MLERAVVVAGVAAIVSCGRDHVPPGYQGVVELDERILSFDVPGRVLTVNTVRGDLIDPTKILATLDDTQARTAVTVREAEALAAGERAKLVAGSGRTEDIRAIEAQLQGARATETILKKRLEDDRKLAANGVIAHVIVDDDEAKYETASSSRRTLEQQLRELRTGGRREEVIGAEATANAAQGTVALERDRALHYQLRAVQPGEVLDVHIDPGEVVAPGTPVLTVGDTTHPYIDIFVPQQSIGSMWTSSTSPGCTARSW
jgi:HlyD family secretion protein